MLLYESIYLFQPEAKVFEGRNHFGVYFASIIVFKIVDSSREHISEHEKKSWLERSSMVTK